MVTFLTPAFTIKSILVTMLEQQRMRAAACPGSSPIKEHWLRPGDRAW